MKVKSNKSVRFPEYDWGISEGEVAELPENEEAQKRILTEDGIEIVSEEESEQINSALNNVETKSKTKNNK